MAIKSIKTVQLNITGVGHKGMAIGRTPEGMVVFVKGGIPGQKALVSLSKKRKGVWQGRIEEILEASIHEVPAFCSHFGICGGCSWQSLDYVEQLRQKEILVRDALIRIAKVDQTSFEPILAAPDVKHYRNKLEFTFSTHRWLTREEIDDDQTNLNKNALGFHRPESFDKVVDINRCYLQDEISNQIRNEVRSYALEKDLSFYDIRTHSGLLRNMIIRTNLKGEVMLVLSASENDGEKLSPLFEHLQTQFPRIISAHLAINIKKNDSWFDLECKKIFGTDALPESLDHVNFNIGPKSFFQTNTLQTVNLYKLIEEYAQLSGGEIVYDVYCGVGSIGIFLARHASKVIGIEEIPAAIVDAHKNAQLNQLDNLVFHTGDARTLLNDEMVLKYGVPDVLIVDPPRVGLHPEVVQSILKFAPKRIIYVSCNPATQARDMAIMNEAYWVKKIRPVDMFPHTNHVEAVALLEWKSNS
ncbi:MAG: 23S rRNA (uracil(1939)-C(5))-methyltransferase RlmD [Saprospiraceae bacterium]|nr:23S rRNA (uracil(1939)-C(5))-methyltransferase RlmD [Candidatus Vicinibacter proximus]